MNEPICVIVVDDHRLFRDGLTQLLNLDERFAVAAQAASGEEFLELLSETACTNVVHSPNSPPALSLSTFPTRSAADPVNESFLPDVVFMDIDMPGMGGVVATRRALELWPDLRIIALSMHGEQEFYLPMLEAGAKGFLLKDSEFADVAAAAGRVAAGGTYFSPELVDALVEAMERDGDRETPENRWAEPLSERETEVLPLICEGLANHEIADRLFISKRTVDKHRANILAKTGCRNTASLVLYAVKNNLIKI